MGPNTEGKFRIPCPGYMTNFKTVAVATNPTQTSSSCSPALQEKLYVPRAGTEPTH